jgi:hypothetical protein
VGVLLIGHRTFYKCDRFAIEIDGEKISPFVSEHGAAGCVFLYEYKDHWVKFERWLWNVESASDKEVEEIKRFAKGFFRKGE